MRKVSICIPAYNNEMSVKRLLDSVFTQTFQDFEIIITDDSDDHKIEELVREYQDDRLRYYKNEHRRGATANWNAAIEKAGGEYVKIMHHDDWFTDKWSLEKFVSMLDRNPGSDFAFSGSRQVSQDNCYDRQISDQDLALLREDYRNLFLRNKIGAPSAVIHRRSKIRYDENLTWLVDSDYYFQFLLQNRDFYLTKEPLVSIGISAGQLTRQCADDEELNLYEYTYVYRKMELHKNRLCRKRLMEEFLKYGRPYSEMRPYRISQFAFLLVMCKRYVKKFIKRDGRDKHVGQNER